MLHYHLSPRHFKIMAEEIKRLAPEAVWGYFCDLTQIPRPTVAKQVTDYLKAFGEKHGWGRTKTRWAMCSSANPPPGYEGDRRSCCSLHRRGAAEERWHGATTSSATRSTPTSTASGSRRATTLGADNGMGVSLAMAALTDKTIKLQPLEEPLHDRREQAWTAPWASSPASEGHDHDQW